VKCRIGSNAALSRSTVGVAVALVPPVSFPEAETVIVSDSSHSHSQVPSHATNSRRNNGPSTGSGRVDFVDW